MNTPSLDAALSVNLASVVAPVAAMLSSQIAVNRIVEIMKKQIAVLTSLVLLAAGSARAVQFDLSPAGTDVATGLSPLNQVPAVTNSTGSGNELFGGINFNTNTLTLTLALGYGSAAGFSNLTASASAMHIHGPASPGTNGPVVADLVPYLFLPQDPALGGIIFGQVVIPTNEVANLLAGLHYINIHTTNNPGGEIRGQLIPVLNSPPAVVCPAPWTVECGAPTTVSAQVSDPDGDALTVVWSVNGAAVQTNALAAGATSTPADSSFTAEFPLGTNLVSVSVTDSAGSAVECGTAVTVVDTIPPTITSAKATPNSLWPPNHRMIPVKLNVQATDLCGTTTWKIASVTSSEAVNAPGSGNTAPDWQFTGQKLSLRAERSGKTGPRIYTISVVATDESGNESQPKTITVTVPHSQNGK